MNSRRLRWLIQPISATISAQEASHSTRLQSEQMRVAHFSRNRSRRLNRASGCRRTSAPRIAPMAKQEAEKMQLTSTSTKTWSSTTSNRHSRQQSTIMANSSIWTPKYHFHKELSSRNNLDGQKCWSRFTRRTRGKDYIKDIPQNMNKVKHITAMRSCAKTLKLLSNQLPNLTKTATMAPSTKVRNNPS